MIGRYLTQVIDFPEVAGLLTTDSFDPSYAFVFVQLYLDEYPYACSLLTHGSLCPPLRF